MLDLLAAMLATWRLAFLVTHEDGPFNVCAWLRAKLPANGKGRWGDLLDCIFCCSIWAGALCVLLTLSPLRPVVWALAASGGALMLASFTGAGGR